MVKSLIQAMIVVVIGLALLPVVSNFATDLTKDAILEPATPAGVFDGTTLEPLINLIPTLYVIILVVGLVAYVYFSRN